MQFFTPHLPLLLSLLLSSATLGLFSTAAFADAQSIEELFLSSDDASSSQAENILLHSVQNRAELEQKLLDLGGLHQDEIDIALLTEDGEVLDVQHASAADLVYLGLALGLVIGMSAQTIIIVFTPTAHLVPTMLVAATVTLLGGIATLVTVDTRQKMLLED